MRCFVIVAMLTISTASSAEPPKYTRKTNVTVDVKLSDRVKRTQPQPRPAPKPSADFLIFIEERTQPIRREQEAVLEKLVRDTPDDDPEKPDLMFRLAEHYAKQLRFWRLQSNTP